MPPPNDPWPIDTHPDHEVPIPPLTLVGIEGRYPYFPGALKAENFHVHIESGWEPGIVVVRLDDEAHPDMHLTLTIRLPR